MYTIENDLLCVVIKPQGAELDSLFNKTTGLEYLWSGDARFWGKKSPVLFPIVGTLKENRYLFDDTSYTLNRHGFAREKMFSVTDQSQTSISFKLQNDETTEKAYPFQFTFIVQYSIDKNNLSVCYKVKNNGKKEMFFSVGGHPAFKIPLADGLTYNEYYLQFNQKENTGHWPINAAGLIESSSQLLLHNTDRLPLTKQLFYDDALVLKHLLSNELQVKSDKHSAGFSFDFTGFPYLGIWAAKDADFVCIEPWCGIADSVNTSQALKDKEGIVSLEANKAFERTWSVTTW